MRTLSPASVRTPLRQYDGPQPASVVRVTGSQLFVELDSARGLEIGPCAWSRPLAPHSHSITGGTTGTYTPPPPAVGTRCLVLFAGRGVSDPWIVGWNGYPA